MLMRLIRVFTAVLLLALVPGCTKGGSDGGGGSGGGNPGGQGNRFTTDCGIVIEGELNNPVSDEAGFVGVEVVSPNVVIVTLSSGRLLVKLHGLDRVSSLLREGALKRLQTLAASGQGFFYQALTDCVVTVEGGGTAVVGQVLTPDGRSFSEELVKSGFANVETRDSCAGNLIGGCYSALADSAPTIGGRVSDFLWKPNSENDGNLVVLLDPSGARVFANGEELQNTGSAAGRGTVARSSKPGCAFGANVRVEVLDRDGDVLIFPGGELLYTIPNGCDRVEFQ